ncbi:hypothetical protein AZ030_004817 [Escherichia coli]|nr:hypothetical protein AZ030_004817 [Escherichia coli]
MLSIRAMARAFFCSKVTGAPPFHDVNVTQLIVIDYYYHAVVMLSCISTPVSYTHLDVYKRQYLYTAQG